MLYSVSLRSMAFLFYGPPSSTQYYVCTTGPDHILRRNHYDKVYKALRLTILQRRVMCPGKGIGHALTWATGSNKIYGISIVYTDQPKLRNSLPVHPRQTDINCEQFKRLIKTFLFACCKRGTLSSTVKSRFSSYYILTHSLT